MAFWNPFKNKLSNIDKTIDDSQTSEKKIYQNLNNENFNIFDSIRDNIKQIVSMRSVVDQQLTNQTILANPISELKLDSNILLPICTNKLERIKQYRAISKFPECDWCLDEICDDFIHEDENGEFIKLKLPENKENLNDIRKEILQNEFKQFIELFNIRDNGFNLIRKFLTEGELCWENIIKHDHPELGIIAVKFLPTEFYETMIDAKTSKPVGLYFNFKNFYDETKNKTSMSYYGYSSQVFNSMVNNSSSYFQGFSKENCILFLWPQLTYINSGNSELNEDGLINFSMIEKAKQAYYQLSLLHDAAVILRVTRAPERLLFNISTGKMTQNYAAEYVRQFANNLKSKKVLAEKKAGTQDITSTYNPVSMLESYIFGKSDGNDGTSVESVGSSASYDEISDIEYFLRRLMKQFKIPFTRYKTPENTMERDESISYEEYSFTRMIVRLQRRFAKGFKNGFITHLKLRDIWNKYNLKESDLNIFFVKPVLFDLYQTQKLVETKMNIYKAIVDNDEMSKILAMKKYLGWNDDEIDENFKYLIKEKMLIELADFWTNKISENGLGGKYSKPPIPLGKKMSDEESSDEESSDEDEDTSDEESSSKDTSDEDTSDKENKETSTFGLS